MAAASGADGPYASARPWPGGKRRQRRVERNFEQLAAQAQANTAADHAFCADQSAEQQARLMLHRTRDLLMRQRTQVINALRAHLAELGIVAAQGREGINELLKIIASEEDERLPVDAHASLVVLAAELQAIQTMIGSIEKRIMVQHRSNEASQRLETIPGIGVIGATAIAATVADPKVFRYR